MCNKMKTLNFWTFLVILQQQQKKNACTLLQAAMHLRGTQIKCQYQSMCIIMWITEYQYLMCTGKPPYLSKYCTAITSVQASATLQWEIRKGCHLQANKNTWYFHLVALQNDLFINQSTCASLCNMRAQVHCKWSWQKTHTVPLLVVYSAAPGRYWERDWPVSSALLLQSGHGSDRRPV